MESVCKQSLSLSIPWVHPKPSTHSQGLGHDWSERADLLKMKSSRSRRMDRARNMAFVVQEANEGTSRWTTGLGTISQTVAWGRAACQTGSHPCPSLIVPDSRCSTWSGPDPTVSRRPRLVRSAVVPCKTTQGKWQGLLRSVGPGTVVNPGSAEEETRRENVREEGTGNNEELCSSNSRNLICEEAAGFGLTDSPNTWTQQSFIGISEGLIFSSE